jgi:hypothetical protein
MAETLSVFDFGKQLIESKDLDPVYVMLWNAKLEQGTLCDWLVAYWCFYHVGTASWVVDNGKSSGDQYWSALLEAASTAEHPRSSERRHFRGQQAVKAVLELRSRRLTCSELVAQLSGPVNDWPPYTTPQAAPSLATVVDRVKQLRGFGDWIAFKVADMLERLDMCPVNFSPSDVLTMYEAPREGAELVRAEYELPKVYPNVYNFLISRLGHLKAPPRYERPINIQEVETILCKWKSHLNGHYKVGKDIAEVKHGLERYKHCPTAKILWVGGRTGGMW